MRNPKQTKTMVVRLKPTTRMDCGHHHDALIWNDDLKKNICSACRDEAYETSFLRQAFKKQNMNHDIMYPLGHLDGYYMEHKDHEKAAHIPEGAAGPVDRFPLKGEIPVRIESLPTTEDVHKFELLRSSTDQDEDPGDNLRHTTTGDQYNANIGLLKRMVQQQSLLLRPNGEPVPQHWTQFQIGECVVIKNYTFKVAYIGETAILFEPVGIPDLGEQR